MPQAILHKIMNSNTLGVIFKMWSQHITTANVLQISSSFAAHLRYVW